MSNITPSSQWLSLFWFLIWNWTPHIIESFHWTRTGLHFSWRWQWRLDTHFCQGICPLVKTLRLNAHVSVLFIWSLCWTWTTRLNFWKCMLYWSLLLLFTTWPLRLNFRATLSMWASHVRYIDRVSNNWISTLSTFSWVLRRFHRLFVYIWRRKPILILLLAIWNMT